MNRYNINATDLLHNYNDIVRAGSLGNFITSTLNGVMNKRSFSYFCNCIPA